MSLRIRVFLVIFLFGFLSVARAQTSGLQTGFAIITVASGNSAGLAASETLSFSASGLPTTHTVVTPAVLLQNSAVAVNLGTSSAGSTGIAIVNPTVSPGHVQLAITDPFGTPILSQTITIVPRGQFSRFLNQLFGSQVTSSTPSAALLTITSDASVGVTALNFQAEGFASLPVQSLSSPFLLSATTFTPSTASSVVVPTSATMMPTATMMPSPVTPFVTTTLSQPAQMATTATIGGAASFIFPQVVTGAGWSSQITVANTSASAQAIRIDFFDPNGISLASVTGITIAPRGLFNLVR